MSSLRHRQKRPVVATGILFSAAILIVAYMHIGAFYSLKRELHAVDVDSPAGRAMLKSQMGQDLYLWNNVFKATRLLRTGFFIEFGAEDGEFNSNSYFFEKALGWRGILLEAIPKEQKNISRSRPGSIVVDGGVCETDGRVTFRMSETPGWGGAAESYDDNGKPDAPRQELEVACFSLRTLTRFFGVRHVDYLSVDTEGSELHALRSFPWTTVSVTVVGVEALVGIDPLRAAKEAEIVAFMSSVGYGVLKRHYVAPDTVDVFFTQLRPPMMRIAHAFDLNTFEEASVVCKELQRCL